MSGVEEEAPAADNMSVDNRTMVGDNKAGSRQWKQQPTVA
jgi:hypothetical protein